MFILHVHVSLDNVLIALKKVKNVNIFTGKCFGSFADIDGYAKNKPITPYMHQMHVMLCHLPGLLQDLGTVKMFTRQGKKIE